MTPKAIISFAVTGAGDTVGKHPAIPETVRQHLFEAFQSSARPGGTGLGLAISAELVHAHSGAIEVKQSNENGTVFLVSIPDAPIELQQRRFGT